MKVLFVVPYPLNSAPSQRFRFEQYFHALEKFGISYQVAPFLHADLWKILYKKGNILKKTLGVLHGLISRVFLLFKLQAYQYIFIHREAAPVGPPFFEYLAKYVFGKKIIFDFDDAIWIENASESNKLFSKLKFFGNPAKICKIAYKVSCGNFFCKILR